MIKSRIKSIMKLTKEHLKPVKEQVWYQVDDQVCDHVRDQVYWPVSDQVDDQVMDQVCDQVRDQVYWPVRDQVYHEIN